MGGMVHTKKEITRGPKEVTAAKVGRRHGYSQRPPLLEEKRQDDFSEKGFNPNLGKISVPSGSTRRLNKNEGQVPLSQETCDERGAKGLGGDNQ